MSATGNGISPQDEYECEIRTLKEMNTPIRIKRNGFYGTLGKNDMLVGRPTRWGNPWKLKDCNCKGAKDGHGHTVEEALNFFREYAVARDAFYPDWLAPLKGKNLACYCELTNPCHADILLELANR